MTKKRAVELQHRGKQSRNISVGSYLSSGISSSSSQSSDCVEIKNQACKVNESLYELHKPSACPSIQIVLFHGLQPGDYSDAHLRTWQSEDGSCIWPETWLVDAVPGAHVLSVSFNGALAKTSENCTEGDMYIITENLLSDLLQANIGQEEYCPVILVGHSIGGLVIKHLCNRANVVLNQKEDRDKARLQKFLNNMEGVFYYATPHHGTSIPKEWEQDLPRALLTYFETLSKDTARLNHDFDQLSKLLNWKLLAVGEDRPTNTGPLKDSSTSVFVPEASARVGDFNVVNGADHFSICKPSDKHSRSFYKLKDFVLMTAKDAEKVAKEREAIRLQEAARARADYQYVPKHVTGLDSRVQEIARKLGSTKTVGLVGMGGLGKTTLAKAVFNRLAADFEYTCFIPDVKFIDGDKRKVFHEIKEDMHFHGKKVQQGSREEWKTKPLLLVLDDISDGRDLDVLSELDDTTAAESRIIFTTRNQSPLGFADKVHRVDFLDDGRAKQLFLSCAFPDHKTPPTELEGLLNDIVQKCEGLPLALEVVGKFLRTVDKYQIWKETLDAMGRAEVRDDINERLWVKLKLSYDGLGETLQEIFLDATTFFSGYDFTLHEAKAAWRAAYNIINENLLWKQLVDMSLVYDVGDNECIRVHEQLLSLGRQIARDSINCDKRREWDGDEGFRLLHNTNELEKRKIFAIRVQGTGMTTHIEHNAILGLKELRYLHVSNLATVTGVQDSLTLPSNLVVLRCLSPEVSKVLLQPHLGANIVLLHLSWEESYLPESLGNLSALQHLGLGWCEQLQSLPESFGNLSALQHLHLGWCEQLQSLPESFGNLSALRHLDLGWCGQLQSLPESFGNLSALQHLDLRGCKQLQSLPESFENLSALQHLDLGLCGQLESLPESFGNLSALQHLDVGWCGQLESLPESFGNLSALQHLDLGECGQLESLPESFGNLSALQHLDLRRCGQLQSLPESFGKLSALQHLDLGGCGQLRSLPESIGNLSALQHVDLCGCGKLQSLPKSFGNLSALQYLDLRRCGQLQSLPESFGNLSALQHLHLGWCGQLQSLPESFGNLSALQHLDLGRCGQLQSLPESFGNLSALQHLDLRGCGQLQSLPESFGNLSTSQHLDLGWCGQLQSLPESFGNLSALQHLDFRRCGQLQSLPESFGNLSALQHLDLRGCGQLQFLPESFGNLSALQHLDLRGCGQLQSLPESFGNLSALQHLDLGWYGQLQSVPESFGNLSTLQHLDLGQCGQLQSLPESFGNLSALQHLHLRWCGQLQSLPESFGNLSALQHLDLGGCGQLQSLPESFGNLSALQHLDLRGCGQLQSLPESFGNLSSLRYLDLWGCGQLQSLPESFGNLCALRYLDLLGCGQLQSLPEYGSLSNLILD